MGVPDAAVPVHHATGQDLALLNLARREDRAAITVLYPESDADGAAVT